MKNSTITGLLMAIMLAAMLVALASCDFNGQADFELRLLGANQFYAQNMVTEKFYIVSAEKLYEDSACVIWAEVGSGIKPDLAKEIAREYDAVIRPKMVDVFSEKDFSEVYAGTEYRFNDMLGYADWLADRNDKLTILLLDIVDGFNPPGKKSYIAGYFFAGDFYTEGPLRDNAGNIMYYSNGRDMIFIDTNPGLKPEHREEAYTNLAHELQHLMNFVTTVYLRRGNVTDTWVDEGLSSQAEYAYLGRNPASKCEWFSLDSLGTIARGNNFFVWGNHGGDAILDDYATVYLFFRWLYLQAGNPLLFHRIANSPFNDFRALTSEAAQIDPAWGDWEALLRTWLAANYYPSALYGYRGDRYLQEGNGSANASFRGIKVNPIGGSTASLYPGEGVYSVINSPIAPAGGGPSIRYAGLGNSAINTSTITGNVLLTYNANSNIAGASETGSLTGVAPARAVMEAAQAGEPRISGPYVLDAGDVLGRNREPVVRERELFSAFRLGADR